MLDQNDMELKCHYEVTKCKAQCSIHLKISQTIHSFNNLFQKYTRELDFMLCFIMHIVLSGIVRGVGTVQADVKTQGEELKSIRKEVTAMRRLLAKPTINERDLTLLDTHLPVSCQEEMKQLENELKEEGKERALVC